MNTLPMHEAVKPLSWLLGKWVATSAKGHFPTINPFEYSDEIEFTTIGQPMLNYTQRTWHQEKKIPMHLESGFLRIKPGTNSVAFMVAHNFGLTTLEEGTVGDEELTLKSTQISRMSFARDPAVIGTERFYKLNGNTLEFIFTMETENVSSKEHLRVVYMKQ